MTNGHGAGRPRAAGVLAALLLAAGLSGARGAAAYELWVTDQSDTAKESGGILYVYDGAGLAANPAAAKPIATLDFGKEPGAYCQQRTGKAVRRPHMILFTKDQRYALLAFLSGHVLVLDAGTKQPVGCILAGANAHAAYPTPDQKLAIGANITEKKLFRIATDYGRGSFAFDPAKDVLDLAALQSAEQPDNAPICPITDASGRYAFVTLRGGGLLVVDVTATPMKVVASLGKDQIRPAGCGGIQVGQTMYINSGGGWPATPVAYDLYAIALDRLPGSVSARRIFAREGEFADSHGMVAIGRYLWSVDRAGNRIDVIDTRTNQRVNTLDLVGPLSDDPAPDLIDASPDGAFAFVTLRSPTPLTGNNPQAGNAKGSTPGIGVIRVSEEGRSGRLEGILRLANPQDGKDVADPHGLAVRK
ncbi:MAG TPA: hypothetical protein VNM66_03370 [Thermodesulfobacteriota bacterium]|nr:hypothetical protein [Thermodesulfobacteriota bacterium]